MKKILLFPVLSISLIMSSCGEREDHYQKGEHYFVKYKSYDEAKEHFEKVDKDSENFTAAQEKIKVIDSIQAVQKAERKIRDSINLIEINKTNRDNFLKELDSELETIGGYDASRNTIDVDAIKNHLSVYDDWKKIIDKANSLYEDDKEIITKSNKLNSKIKYTLKKSYPKLRKAYGDFTKNKLWEQDIDVVLKGRGYTTIEFRGSLFASNANIKQVQSEIGTMLRELRFNRVNYKFTKYDDEYTYYDINSLDDSEFPD